MKALIADGDSGIGRAVAIAYTREEADLAISLPTVLLERERIKRETIKQR